MYDTCSATTDGLTGAYLRDALHANADTALAVAQPLALVVIDLDHFKSINDAFGHARGDSVLSEFAQRVREVIRSNDRFYRTGGDEFVLLLPHTTRAQGEMVGQRLLANMQQTPFSGTPPVTMTASLGVAAAPEDGATAEALLAAADRRSYHAKRSGRGQVVGYDPPEAPPALHTPERLIERDRASEAVQRLFTTLPTYNRGLVHFTGPAGVGHSRMLRAIGDMARLQGYGVLALQGSPALRGRVLGVLAQRRQLAASLPAPTVGADAFAQALQHYLQAEGLQGLLITLDQPNDIDQASAALLQALFLTSGIERLTLAVAGEAPNWVTTLRHEAQLSTHVLLEPLSPQGVRAWLRHSLHCEPSDSLCDWLYQETAGLPQVLAWSLDYLVRERQLTPGTGTWQVLAAPNTLPQRPLAELARARPTHNLPGGLSNFVGRETELDMLNHLVLHQRLVVLMGPGGLGKTRLAIQSAAELTPHFPDGVCWVPLATVAAPHLLPPALASALQLNHTSDDPQQQLLQALRGRRMLLLLDNVEQLSADLSLLELLLTQTTGVHVLLTSRVPLGLPNAYECHLTGLAMPDGATDDTAEAVQLFHHYARQADPSFTLATEQNAVLEICRLVDGMPLALELAAAQVRHFTCQQIVQTIQANLSLLASQDEEVSPRHRSMAAVIESFWWLLSDNERQVLRALGCFSGGFCLSSASQIAKASPFFLSALVSSGYLRRKPGGRYDMHELLRQYALHQLTLHPEEYRQTRTRHMHYFAAYMQQRTTALRADRAAQDEVRIELANLELAWAWAIATHSEQPISQMCEGLVVLYILGGQATTGLATVDAALAAFRRRRTRTAQHVVPLLHGQRAALLNELSRYTEARAAARRAVQCARAHTQTETLALGHVEWGRALLQQSNFAAAQVHFEQALVLAANLPRIAAYVFRLQGRSGYLQADYLTARRAYEQALALAQAEQDRRNEGLILSALGQLLHILGEASLAREYSQAALELCRELGDRYGESRALLALSNIDFNEGHVAACLAMRRDALQICREIGDRYGEGIAVHEVAMVLHIAGQMVAARPYFEESLRISQELGDRQGEVATQHLIGDLYAQYGDHASAHSCYNQALALNESVGDREIGAWLVLKLAHLAYREGQLAHGLALLHDMLATEHTALYPRLYYRTLTLRGHLLAAMELYPEAAAVYEQVKPLLAQVPPQATIHFELLAGFARVAQGQGRLPQALALVEP
nr:diguanylate cyclase [Chloroflexaceae bacterium]